MLKQIRNAMLLITILLVGACNSVTAPTNNGRNQDQGNNDIGKYEDNDEDVNVDDEFEPPNDGGGGGSGPGEKDNHPEQPGRNNRFPHEWTPEDMGGGGPGSSNGADQGEDEEEKRRGGSKDDWTPGV